MKAGADAGLGCPEGSTSANTIWLEAYAVANLPPAAGNAQSTIKTNPGLPPCHLLPVAHKA